MGDLYRGLRPDRAALLNRLFKPIRRWESHATRLVLLERNGEPTWGNEVDGAEIRAALDSLIA